jgi:DNA-binding CsgD family transcriptional regulator
MLDPKHLQSTDSSSGKLPALRDLWAEVANFPVWDATAALNHTLGRLCNLLEAEGASWLVMRKEAKIPRDISPDHYKTIFEKMEGWSPMAAEYLDSEKTFKRVVERWLMHARKEGVDPMSQSILDGAGKRSRACIRHDVTTDQEWADHWLSKKFLQFYGIGERLVACIPLNPTCESVIIIDRPIGADPFTPEDREFMNVAIASMPHLHNRLCMERGLLMSSSMLSNREIDTYRLLLTDLSENQIADRLKLSTHTVHDYARQLYRKFGVKGRVGLMAMVLSV